MCNIEKKSEVLEGLKCRLCDGYVSCKPVYILADGSNVCGRCLAPANQAPRRNLFYERVAQLMKFPCRYKSVGCSNTAVFGLLTTHETCCKYRQSICPVSKPAECAWTGALLDMLYHCKQNHPNTLLENPITLEHNSAKANARTFIMTAFQLLFIVYAKVCLTSSKIYHSVYLLFDADENVEFYFDLVVSNKDNRIIQSGKIVTLQAGLEDNSVSLSLGVILDLFGGLDDVLFEIMINRQLSKLKVITWPNQSFTDRGGRGGKPTRRYTGGIQSFSNRKS